MSRNNIVCLTIFVFLLSFPGKPIWAQTGGRHWYVDCQGNDGNDGLSPSTAWRTLAKAGNAPLAAGDMLLLRRDCIWRDETLDLSASGTQQQPILIQTYGSGVRPAIINSAHGTVDVRIRGSNLVIDSLHVGAVAPMTEAGCANNPKGYIIGFSFESGSSRVTLKKSRAEHLYAGVFIKAGAAHHQIRENEIVNNTMMWPLDPGGSGDAGAFGVLIWGDHTIVSGNTISGHDACSYDYGRDGGAVELYGGNGAHPTVGNVISYNTAAQNDAFTELGKSSGTVSDTVFAYNLVTSSLPDSIFLNTRGAGSYGPILRTVSYNNTVYLTGTQSQGIVCSRCAPDILKVRNTILRVEGKAVYTNVPFDEGHTIYWKSTGNPLVQGFTPATTSKITDPLFVSAGNDFRLTVGSPARNWGSGEILTAGYHRDLAGTAVPQGSMPDIGAYEYFEPGSASVTPPPAVTPIATSSPNPPTPSHPPPSACDKTHPAQFSCYGIWYVEYHTGSGTLNADFNNDAKVSLADFEVWRQVFIEANSGTISSYDL